MGAKPSTRRTRRLSRRRLAVAEVVRGRQRAVDVRLLGDAPGERAERLELRDEDVPVPLDPLVPAAGEQERLPPPARAAAGGDRPGGRRGPPPPRSPLPPPRRPPPPPPPPPAAPR